MSKDKPVDLDLPKATPHESELHLDDETDTLYDDGLDVEDDTDQLAGTRATEHRS